MKYFRLNASILLATVLGLTTSVAYANEMVLKYSLTETRTPSPVQEKNSKKEKEISLSSKKTVVFGSDFFSVKEKKLERIYDFKKRRIHYLDHQAKTRSEISLFADPAFRINEFQHRTDMNEAVQKAGGKVWEDVFSLESIFGIERQDKKVLLTEDVSEKDKMKFLKEKQLVSEVSFSENHLDNQAKLFNQFLIYDNSIHPQVRKKIIEKQRIPSVMRTRLESPDGVDHFVLILDGVITQKDQGFQIPRNYIFSKKQPGTVASATTLFQLLQSVEMGKSKVVRKDKEWFENKIRLSSEKKNYLEATLVALEYGLQTGDQKWTATEIEKLVIHQKEDEDLNRFLRSLGVSGPKQAERAISELQKINRKKISRPHIIDIIIANQQSVLGQNGLAQKRMLTALKANPYIAGAYKDLGDMFYADFDMVSAWRCWDFSRKQAPDHFMLKPVSDYEKELVRDFPDFF